MGFPAVTATVAARHIARQSLRHSKLTTLSADAPTGLLVQPEIAEQQLEAETQPPTDSTKDTNKAHGSETDTESSKQRQECHRRPCA